MKKRTQLYEVAVMAILYLTVLSSCTNSGGVWLGEGEANGKAYTFGTPSETEMLQAIAKAYSEKDTKTLFLIMTMTLWMKNQERIWANGWNLWKA